jgi:hypothetical protein
MGSFLRYRQNSNYLLLLLGYLGKHKALSSLANLLEILISYTTSVLAQVTPNSSVHMSHPVSSKQHVEQNVIKKKDVRLGERTPGRLAILRLQIKLLRRSASAQVCNVV